MRVSLFTRLMLAFGAVAGIAILLAMLLLDGQLSDDIADATRGRHEVAVYSAGQILRLHLRDLQDLYARGSLEEVGAAHPDTAFLHLSDTGVILGRAGAERSFPEKPRESHFFIIDEALQAVVVVPRGNGRLIAVEPIPKSLIAEWSVLVGGDIRLEASADGSEGVRGVAVHIDLYSESLPLTLVRARENLLIAGLVSMVAALLCGIFISRSVSRDVHRLKEAMDRIGWQNFSKRIESRRGDEIGDVSRALDEMTDRLAALGKNERRTRTRLEVARDAADASNRAKMEFMTNISHEIRTPMNGMIGMTSLLIDTTLTSEQQEYAETIQKCSESLLALINDVLDFSKIEAGKLTIEPIPFDLRLLIEDAADLMAVRANQKGLELIVRYDPKAPTRVVGDAGRIRQVLTNLLSNALKFTEKGHVLVHLDAVGSSDKETTITVTVKDTGIGIPPDQLGAIFDRFTQVDASTTRKYGGTGLGLAISRQLIELMDGSLAAESEPDQGSSFAFTLRLPLDTTPLATPAPAKLDGTRILVVDDNEVNRRVVCEQLLNWGARAESASSAAEALEMMRKADEAGEPYRIAVLDYMMPDMDGVALARDIKSDPRLANTLLVMLTSVGRRGDAKTMEEAGFAAYLLKPVRQTLLRDALSAVWASRSEDRSGILTRTRLVTRHTIAEARPRATETAGGSGRTRVLVVEDNTVNQVVAVRMLEKLGCRVDVAHDGLEAVEKTARIPYQVIFMDCQMPRMDGFEATEKIRAQEQTRTPIVAMTAHAFQVDKERCLKAGMDDYLSKPLGEDPLQKALNRWAGSAPEPARAESPIDTAAVEKLKKLQPKSGDAFVTEVIDLFLKDTPEAFARMRAALAQGDGTVLAREAHSLKASAATLGAVGMASLCKELEHEARNGSIDKARRTLRNVEEDFEGVRESLERLRIEST